MLQAGTASRFGVSSGRALPRRPARAGRPTRAASADGARAAGVAHAATLAIQAAVIVIITFSIGNFSQALVPVDASSNLQQYVALAMWMIVLGASFLAAPAIRIAPTSDALFIFTVGFYGFAALSIAWSNHSPASLMKGLALVITTFGAYRLAVSLSLERIVFCVIAGLFALCAASTFLAVFVPDIGVLKTWMHNGQWAGVFESKQSLGVAGALLMFFSAYRALTRGGRLSFLLTFSVAVASVIGSGSRGGGALALAAIASLYLSRRSTTFARLFAFGPLVMICIANALIIYLICTGYSFIPLFGEKIDFTERAIIWQYALSHFSDGGILGFGLNGFWTIEKAYYGFLREHGWVLDNFHSGYIAVLMETGVLGMALFALCHGFFGIKAWWLASSRVIPRAHYNVLVNFANLSFFINFTETLFLRSTNFISMLLVVFIFVACRSGVDAEGGNGRAASDARCRGARHAAWKRTPREHTHAR